MNKNRKLAALKRNIGHIEQELARMEELRSKGEPTVLAFPHRVDEYMIELRRKLEAYKAEAARLAE